VGRAPHAAAGAQAAAARRAPRAPAAAAGGAARAAAARAAVKMSDADRVVVGRTQRVVRYAPVVMIEFTIE
jgi:hypothetical protein